MKLRRISRPRAWLVGFGTLVGAGTVVLEYAALAGFLIQAPYKELLPGVMFAGFILAVAVLSTSEDPEPSLVVDHLCEYDDDGSGETTRYDYLVFRNVGHFALTQVRLEPISILEISVRLSREIPALSPSDGDVRIQLQSLGPAVDKVRRKFAKSNPETRSPAYVIKLTVGCLDWKQEVPHSFEYALTIFGSNRSEVRRVQANEVVAWTDFDQLIQSHVPEPASC